MIEIFAVIVMLFFAIVAIAADVNGGVPPRWLDFRGKRKTGPMLPPEIDRLHTDLSNELGDLIIANKNFSRQREIEKQLKEIQGVFLWPFSENLNR